MPQNAFYVFADASRRTADSYAFAFKHLEQASVGLGSRKTPTTTIL